MVQMQWLFKINITLKMVIQEVSENKNTSFSQEVSKINEVWIRNHCR